jgi:hypothetical protein
MECRAPGRPEELEADDAGLGALADEAEAAFPQDTDGGSQLAADRSRFRIGLRKIAVIAGPAEGYGQAALGGGTSWESSHLTPSSTVRKTWVAAK